MRALALLLVLLSLSCTHALPDPAEAVRKRAERKKLTRHDQPGAAAAYYESKRAGADDRFARYAAARQQMQRMPHHSTAAEGARARSTGETSSPFRTPWTFLGPGNIGGRTRTLIIDRADTNVMYAGGVSGGVWKTVDGGAHWRGVADELANIAVNSLAMDPRDRSTLYAGTGEGYFREEVRGTGLPLRGNGIFVSRDAGETWAQLPATANENFHWVNDLAISVHDSQRIYAATRTGVWRSADGGTSWSHVLTTTVKGGCLDLAQRTDTTGDYLFASCGTFEQAAVYRSANAQSNDAWANVLSEPFMGRTSLAIAPSRPSTIYAMAASNEPGAERYQALLAVYRSDSNGDPGSWTAVSNNTDSRKLDRLLLTNAVVASSRECFDEPDSYVTMGWYCNVIAVDPADHRRVWAAGVDLFRSDDGGVNWGMATYWWGGGEPSYAHADHHAIVFHPDYNGTSNQRMFSANDGGIYRSDNARASVATGSQAACSTALSNVRFVPLNHDLGITQFYHGAVFPDGRAFLAGAQDNGTIFGSIDGGVNGWQMVWGGDGGYVAIDQDQPERVLVQSQFANIVKTLNLGRDFRSATSGLTGQFLFITPLLMDPGNSRRVWTGGRRMFRSDDQADTWVPASNFVDGLVSAIAVARGNEGNVVVAGTNSGVIYRTANGTSATGTTTWASSTPRTGFVSSLAFDPYDARTVYATYAGFGGTHVWKSTDGAVTWSPLDGSGSGAIPDIPVHSLAIDPYDRSHLFLGTDLGVFVSLDGGATWQVENSGFAAVVTETVVIAQGANGPAVYAFTHGRGVWRAELTSRNRRRSVGR